MMEPLMYISLQNIYVPSYITEKTRFSGQHSNSLCGGSRFKTQEPVRS